MTERIKPSFIQSLGANISSRDVTRGRDKAAMDGSAAQHSLSLCAPSAPPPRPRRLSLALVFLPSLVSRLLTFWFIVGLFFIYILRLYSLASCVIVFFCVIFFLSFVFLIITRSVGSVFYSYYFFFLSHSRVRIPLLFQFLPSFIVSLSISSTY